METLWKWVKAFFNFIFAIPKFLHKMIEKAAKLVKPKMPFLRLVIGVCAGVIAYIANSVPLYIIAAISGLPAIIYWTLSVILDFIEMCKNALDYKLGAVRYIIDRFKRL